MISSNHCTAGSRAERGPAEGGSVVARITVTPFHGVAEELYQLAFGRRPHIASEDVVRNLIAKTADALDITEFSTRFLVSEWTHVVDAWQLDSEEAYANVPRLGRKNRMGAKQRVRLWPVFAAIRKTLAERGLFTWATVFAEVATHYSVRADKPFHHIVIDEAQDLGVPELRLLAAISADSSDPLFFAGDLGQRIFQQPFSWLGLGIDVRGRSQTLKVNYRTSHQIRLAADRLLPQVLRDVDGLEEQRVGTLSVFNGPAPVAQDLLKKHRPDMRREVTAGALGPFFLDFTSEEWRTALDLLAQENAAARDEYNDITKRAIATANAKNEISLPKMRRFYAVQVEIVKRCESGELIAAYRPPLGGAMKVMPREWWNTDRWLSRFAFGRGALNHLLKNRHYLGEIVHKGVSHPGAHPAIVDAVLFDAVQQKIAANTHERRERPLRSGSALLKGLLFDAEGEPMSPSFGYGKSGRLYRYYVSAPLQQGKGSTADGVVRRVAAPLLEEAVRQAVLRIARAPDDSAIRTALARIELDLKCITIRLRRAALSKRQNPAEQDLALAASRLLPGEDAELDGDGTLIRVRIPVCLRARGGRTWLTQGNTALPVGQKRIDPVMTKALRQAHALISAAGVHPSRRAATEGKGLGDPYHRKLAPLAFLSPTIQRAILEGRQPAALTLSGLIAGELPLAWNEQERLFGF